MNNNLFAHAITTAERVPAQAAAGLTEGIIHQLEHVTRLLEQSGYELARSDTSADAPQLFLAAASVERVIARLKA